MPAVGKAGELNVLYAGSLVNLMEHGIAPAFDHATGNSFRGFAAGSNALANQIKGKLRQADVFISASPKVNDSLTGPANGEWVGWYVTFAQSPLVIGYDPASRFAAELKSKPWYEVLREPGIRIGRSDPKLDPKGALTVQLLDQAGQVYHQPQLAADVLGGEENPAQVLPEENLVGRLQSGQLDVGFFLLHGNGGPAHRRHFAAARGRGQRPLHGDHPERCARRGGSGPVRDVSARRVRAGHHAAARAGHGAAHR